MCVLASSGSKNTVVIRVEDEGPYNWLHTSTCSVWEFQASPRRDIPTAFGISFTLPLDFLHFGLDSLRSVLCVR